MFGPKLKIPAALYERLRAASEAAGCSIEDLAERGIEKEIDRVLSQRQDKQATEAEVQEIAAKLKGLGYLE